MLRKNVIKILEIQCALFMTEIDQFGNPTTWDKLEIETEEELPFTYGKVSTIDSHSRTDEKSYTASYCLVRMSIPRNERWEYRLEREFLCKCHEYSSESLPIERTSKWHRSILPSLTQCDRGIADCNQTWHRQMLFSTEFEETYQVTHKQSAIKSVSWQLLIDAHNWNSQFLRALCLMTNYLSLFAWKWFCFVLIARRCLSFFLSHLSKTIVDWK